MSIPDTGDQITIRATLGSYFALCSIWVILALGYIILSIKSPGRGLGLGALIAGGVALLWGVWLRGFKVVVSTKFLEYRDGFFRMCRVSIGEIVELREEWNQWKFLGKGIRVRRIVVITSSGKRRIWINPKPFGRTDLRRVYTMLDNTRKAKGTGR